VDPYIDLMTNTMMITFSKSLCDARSVVALDFSIDPIQTVTERIKAENASEIEVILDQNYQVIAHSDKAEIGKSYLKEAKTLGGMAVAELRRANSDFFQIDYEGADYIIYATRVSNDWYCLSIANATNAFKQLNVLMLFTVLIGLLVFIILAVILIHSNKRQVQFAQLSIQVVESLAAAIDAKDHYTNGHSDRVARYAKEIGKPYESLRLIVVHMGGGVSVGAHIGGKVVDVFNALDGDGAFSPERAGAVPSGALIKMCFSGKYTEKEVYSKICGKGGFNAYLGTNDMREVTKMANEGNEEAKLAKAAFLHQVAKDIGSMACVLKGQVDQIIVTGGIAYGADVVASLKESAEWIAPFTVYPGEDELLALAQGGLRVLNGEEKACEY